MYTEHVHISTPLYRLFFYGMLTVFSYQLWVGFVSVLTTCIWFGVIILIVFTSEKFNLGRVGSYIFSFLLTLLSLFGMFFALLAGQ